MLTRQKNLIVVFALVAALLFTACTDILEAAEAGPSSPPTYSVNADPLPYLATSPALAHAVAETKRIEESHRTWWIAVTNNRLAAEAAARKEAARRAAVAARKRSVLAASRTRNMHTVGTGRCGGDLPPCYVMMRESRGDIHAENPTSTASGKWQVLDSTWGGFGGYSHASYAPESVQDAFARQLWAGGRGCSHWSAC